MDGTGRGSSLIISSVPLLLIWTVLIGKLAFLLFCLVFSFMLLTVDTLRHTREFIGQGASSAGAFQYLLTSLCKFRFGSRKKATGLLV